MPPMTTPDQREADVAKIAASLTEAGRRYVMATPLQMPSDAGVIAYRAGDLTGGGAFAGFVRKLPSLFTRLVNGYGTAFQYRLSPLGQQVRAHLLKGNSDA